MRSLLCTAAALALSTPALAQYRVVEVKDGGTISGKISHNGRAPAPRKITITKDTAVCGTSREERAIEVSPDGGVKNVVVYLKDVQSGKKMDDDVKPALDQKECHYLPHVQVVPVHATLQVRSSDAILHNVHSFLNGSTVINFAMPPQKGLVLTKRLDKPGGQQLKCDVHSFMKGGIFVADNPYHALTKEDGTYEIKDVPPGSYTIATWHEAAGSLAGKIAVPANGKVTFNGKVR